MQFKPKSAKEIAELNVWPKGTYDFDVVKAERAVSGEKSKTPGTEFIKLNVRIFNDDGKFKFVNGILHPAMEAQLRHFCEVGDMLDKYDAGTFEADDCIGVSGKLKLKIKEAQGDFPEKNEIADFLPERKLEESKEPEPTKQVAEKGDLPDDDVPF